MFSDWPAGCFEREGEEEGLLEPKH